MAERLDQWPRVHSCLRNWCPKRSDDCKTCDAVCKLLIEGDKKERQRQADDWDRARGIEGWITPSPPAEGGDANKTS